MAGASQTGWPLRVLVRSQILVGATGKLRERLTLLRRGGCRGSLRLFVQILAVEAHALWG